MSWSENGNSKIIKSPACRKCEWKIVEQEEKLCDEVETI